MSRKISYQNNKLLQPNLTRQYEIIAHNILFDIVNRI